MKKTVSKQVTGTYWYPTYNNWKFDVSTATLLSIEVDKMHLTHMSLDLSQVKISHFIFVK